MSVDIRQWSLFDKIAVGAGAVVFVFSFISSYLVVSFMGFSAGVSAWHSYATFGLLLCFAAVAVVVLRTMQPAVLPEGVPWALVAGGAAALGWFLILLRGLTVDGAHIGWSGWIVIIAALVLAAAAIVPQTKYAGTVEDKIRSVTPGS